MYRNEHKEPIIDRLYLRCLRWQFEIYFLKIWHYLPEYITKLFQYNSRRDCNAYKASFGTGKACYMPLQSEHYIKHRYPYMRTKDLILNFFMKPRININYINIFDYLNFQTKYLNQSDTNVSSVGRQIQLSKRLSPNL